MSEMLIEFRQVSKSFVLGSSVVRVFHQLQAEFQAAELTTIQGASGTGKTTLLHLLAGLERPTEGEILWRNERLRGWSRTKLATWRRSQIGLVFQSYHLLPELTALENVALPALLAGCLDRDRARDLLQRVGLEHRLTHRPGELSGGEQQRVALARSLCNHPQLILADEPTGNLDRETGEKVMTLLFELCREEKAALIMVTHDSALASWGDKRLILRNQKLNPFDF